MNVVRVPREIKEAEIQKDLLYIEEQEVTRLANTYAESLFRGPNYSATRKL